MSSDRRDRPPLPPWLGRPSEAVYRAVVASRNRRFDSGAGVTRLPWPVISVGNLSVGGTGKTPLVMRLVEALRAAGHRPMIAMRGYRAKAGGPSDEQAEYLARFPDILIVAQPDRTAGVRTLHQRDPSAADCILLDDGFQHRRIARDLDIVLIDATRPPTADRCLPAGWLREPIESLSRAHVAVLTHTESVADDASNQIEASLRRCNSNLVVVRSRHDWAGMTIGPHTYGTDWLRGRTVALACGIGNPAPFLASAERHGAHVVHRAIHPDHHEWSRRDLRDLAARAPTASVLLTTRKDWVKIAPLLDAESLPWPVGYPQLRLRVDRGEPELLSRVLAAARGRPAAP